LGQIKLNDFEYKEQIWVEEIKEPSVEKFGEGPTEKAASEKLNATRKKSSRNN